MSFIAALPYIVQGVSLASKLLSGDSPRDKAIKQLQKIAEQGQDPEQFFALLEKIRSGADIQGNRQAQALAARGLDPTGPLAQARRRAAMRSTNAQAGALKAGFKAGSDRMKLSALSQLAGQPQDTSFGDSLTSASKLLIANKFFPAIDKSASGKIPGGTGINAAKAFTFSGPDNTPFLQRDFTKYLPPQENKIDVPGARD